MGEPHSSSSTLVGRPLRKCSLKNVGGLRAMSRSWAARSGSGRRTSRVPMCRSEPAVEPAAPMRRGDEDDPADLRPRPEEQGAVEEVAIVGLAGELAERAGR